MGSWVGGGSHKSRFWAPGVTKESYGILEQVFMDILSLLVVRKDMYD